MHLVADALIPHPRPRVFATYRDRLVDLVEHLPNIRKIEIHSRTERAGEVDLVNEWFGGGDIPAVARSVLNESMLRWTDHATWIERDFRVVWRTEIHAFPGAVRTSGANRFVEVDGGTRLEVRGDFVCDPSKVPGVPRLLAKSIGAAIEKFMVAQIAKNAHEIARGVARLVADEAAH